MIPSSKRYMAQFGGEPFSITVELEGESAKLIELRVADYIGKLADMTPLWEAVEKEYRVEVEDAFDSEGASWGESWLGLKASTMRDRERKGFGPDHPILVRTGTLKESLIGTGSLNLSVRKPREWVFGTRVPYAVFHQSRRPRRMLARRPFLVITAKFRLFIVRRLHEFLRGKL